MTPMQAIQAATIDAAELIGWPRKVGAVEAGRFADIIAVQGDPLKNVEVLENVSFVMKCGKVYRHRASEHLQIFFRAVIGRERNDHQ